MPLHHRVHVAPLVGHGVVHAATKLGVNLAQFRLPALAHRLAAHLEPSLAGHRTEVRNAQEVEALRFARSTLRSRRGCESAELDQPCLVGVQCEPKVLEPAPKLLEGMGVSAILWTARRFL